LNSNKSQKILFITQEFNSGGASYLAIRLIRKLITNYQVDLLVVGRSDDEMFSELPKSVIVYKLRPIMYDIRGYFGSRNIIKQISYSKKLQLLNPFKSSYDIVISTSIFPSWQACIAHANINAKHKIIFLVDESLSRYKNFRLGTKTAIDLSILCSETIVSVSTSLFDSLVNACDSLKSKRLIVLPPLIDNAFDEYRVKEIFKQTKAPRRLFVLTVARLVPGKRIMDCLKIHNELLKEGVFFDWYVVGEGKEKNKIKHEITRLGLEDSFILVGAQKNIAEWMSNADIFALFSDSEGCPTVILEALHMKCPVITTAVHGVSEFIKSEVNGLIVSSEINKIKHGLKRLLIDEELRKSFKNELKNDSIKSRIDINFNKLIDSFSEKKPMQISIPLVSILIPTYMQEASIDKAIASALMQNFESLEVVVIDDCSSDSTREICKKWLKDPRFHYVRNDENIGRVANYRKALYNIARGQWVVMLDGDDYLIAPNFIEKCFILMKKYEQSEIVFFQAGHTVKYINSTKGDVKILPKIDADDMLMNGGDYLKFVFKTRFFTHLGVLYNRKQAIKNNCYQLDISSSDMDSFMRLALEGDVVLINDTVGCWVQNGLNASSNLAINKVSENVVIFRDIANLAIQKALLGKVEIDSLLTRYEAHTLAYLYWNAIHRESNTDISIAHLFKTINSIHPSLFFTKKIIKLMIKLVYLKFKAISNES
jgi:glycosyltransferase involved in cell wall biosynthesis